MKLDSPFMPFSSFFDTYVSPGIEVAVDGFESNIQRHDREPVNKTELTVLDHFL